MLIFCLVKTETINIQFIIMIMIMTVSREVLQQQIAKKEIYIICITLYYLSSVMAWLPTLMSITLYYSMVMLMIISGDKNRATRKEI